MYTSEFLKNTKLVPYNLGKDYKDGDPSVLYSYPYKATGGIFRLEGIPCDLDGDIIHADIAYICKGNGSELGLLQIIELDSGILFIHSDIRNGKNKIYIYTQNDVPNAYAVVEKYLLLPIWNFDSEDMPPKSTFAIKGAESYSINALGDYMAKLLESNIRLRTVVGSSDTETGYRQLDIISKSFAVGFDIDISDGSIFLWNADYSEYKGTKKFGKNVIFKGDADFHSSGVEEIPDGTIFEKDADFKDCKNLKKIGNNVIFKGTVDFRGSGVEEIPDDLLTGVQVQIKIQTGKLDYIPDGTIFEGNTHFSDYSNLKKIGKNVVFKGDADFFGIEEIGDNSIFEGSIYFSEIKNLKKIGKNVKFKRSISLRGSGIEEISDGTIFEKDAYFNDCQKLKKIGLNVVFKGDVSFSGTCIEEITDDLSKGLQLQIQIQTGKIDYIPDGTIFDGAVDFSGCKNLKKMGKNIEFKGPIFLSGSGIEEISDGTIFWDKVNFYNCKNIKKIGKNVKFKLESEFENSGIEEIGDGTIFCRIANFSYDSGTLKKIGKNVIFKWKSNFSSSLIEIGDGTIFEEITNLYSCKDLKTIGKNVVFKGDVYFIESGIEEIPDDTIFGKSALFQNCKNLKTIGKNVIFKGNVDFSGSGIEKIGDGTIFMRNAYFAGGGIKELPPGVICESEVRFDL